MPLITQTAEAGIIHAKVRTALQTDKGIPVRGIAATQVGTLEAAMQAVGKVRVKDKVADRAVGKVGAKGRKLHLAV
jgi:hypothetical protein